MDRNRLWALMGLVAAAALLRLIPHPANFTPVGAIALFGGACFADRRLAFAIPLAAMAVSDALLGALFLGWAAVNGVTPAVYASLLLCGVLGLGLRGSRSPVRVGGMSVIAAVVFFVVTNLAVFLSSGLYPLSASGLVACYTAAIPFFGNTLAGHLLYSAALFGGLALMERGVLPVRPAAASA